MTTTNSWDKVSVDYSQIISPFNNLAIKKAIELLPLNLIEGPILVPGVGPAYELIMLSHKYPKKDYIAFDYSQEMVELAKKNISDIKINTNIEIKQLDLMDLEENISSLTVSFFLTHIMPDQVGAAIKQFKSLKKDGMLAMVYVPPKQRPEGPLFYFFKATQEVLGTNSKNWENEIEESFHLLNVKELELKDLIVEWSFQELEDFRKTMETLPRIKAIKSKVSHDIYEKIWEVYYKDSGLVFKKDKYRGNVSIRLLICKK